MNAVGIDRPPELAHVTRLIIHCAAACLLIGCGAGRVAAWLYLGKRVLLAAVVGLAALLVAGAYLLAVATPIVGVTSIALPFAIGFGMGEGAFFAALAGQGLVTWIVALLFLRGFCWLRKYDEEFAKKHGDAGQRG